MTFLMPYFKQILKSHIGLTVYYLLGILICYSAQGTSFTDDSLAWINFFKRNGWIGFWQSYEMTSIFYLHDLFSNFMYKLFGSNRLAWFFVILFFHSSASYFLFKFLHVLLSDKRDAFFIGFISSICFLSGAYNGENIYWIATYHYLISMLYLTYSLYQVAAQKGLIDRKTFLKVFIPFPFMLTMHEISFFFPFVFALIVLYYHILNKRKWNKWKRWILLLTPFGLSSFFILILTKYFKGSFIPHYGSGHIENHNIFSFFYTLFKYTEKHFLFIHNMPYNFRELLYDVDTRTMYIFFTAVTIIIGFFIYYYKKKLRSHANLIVLIAIMLILFIPVSNMYFFWHFPFQNDRLGYYFSAFTFPIFIYLLVTLFNKYGKLIALTFMCINFIVFRINAESISEANFFYHNVLTPSYQPYLDKKPVILNLPYNYKGVYVYRHKLRFPSAMYFFYEKDISYTYCTSNPIINKSDSIIATKVSDSQFHIQLVAPGAWLMKETMGGTDYENYEVKVDFADDNQSALVKLKTFNNNQPILYCTGYDGFKELK